MLYAQEADLYDWPVSDLEGGLLVEAARPGYRQVAADLRQEILSGDLAAGEAIPANSALAARYGVSMAIANSAVGQLAREGLVRVEHGRPTVVLERRRYHAEITVRWASGAPVPESALDAAAEALDRAEEADPDVTDADLLLSGDMLTAGMDVLAADLSQAVTRALAVTMLAAGGDGWERPAAAAAREIPSP